MSKSENVNIGIEIICLVLYDELNITLNYNMNNFNDLEIKRFREIYLNKIEELISFLQQTKEIHLTPSDFDSEEISEEDLRILFN